MAPTIIMGNETSKESNNNKENTLTIVNTNDKLRLKTIVAGSENKPKTSKSIIKIPSNVKLDMEGGKILLKNTGNATNENLDVLVENSSREVRTFSTNNNSNVNIVLDNVKYGFIKDAKLKLDGEIDNLTLKGETLVEILDETNIGTLNLSKDEMERYPTIKIDKVEATNWGDDDFPTSTDNNNGRLVVNKIISNTDNAVIDLLNSASVNTVEGNFRLKDVEDRANFNGLPIDKGNPTIDNAIDDTSKPTVPTTNDTDTNDNPTSVDNSNGGTDAGNSTIGSGGNIAPSVDEHNNQDGGSPTENNDNTAVAPTEPTNPTTDTTSTDGNTANDGTANEPNTPIEPKDDVDNSIDTDANSSNGDKPDEPNANSSGNTTDSTTEVDNSTSGSTDSNNEAEKPSETSEEKNEEKQPEVVKEKEKELPKARIILNGDISRVLSNIMEENYYILENNTKDGIWLSGLTNRNKFGNTYKVENNAIVVGYNKTNYGLGFSYNKLKIEDKVDEIKSDLFTTYGNAKLKIEDNVFFLTTSLGVNKSRIGNNILFGNKVMYGHEIDFNSIKITPMIELKHLLIKEKGYEIPEIKAKINPKTINYLSTMIGTRVSYENDNLKLFTQFGFDMNMKNKNEIRTLTVDGVPHININEKMDPITKEFIFGAEYEIIKNLNMGLNYKGRHQDSKLSNTFNFSIKYSF